MRIYVTMAGGLHSSSYMVGTLGVSVIRNWGSSSIKAVPYVLITHLLLGMAAKLAAIGTEECLYRGQPQAGLLPEL